MHCHESGEPCAAVRGAKAIVSEFETGDRAGRGREAIMGDATRGDATFSPDHVRIESTLDWYFNFADADLGLRSNYVATVAFLNNPCERTVATSDAAEEAMFRAVEAIRRFRAVSAVVNRLSKRDQRDLHQSFTRRRCPLELTPRPAAERWFAISSPAVREYLRGHGHKHWTFEAGERLLVLAQRAAKDQEPHELATERVEAWTFAERALEALLRRYAAAERAAAAEAAAALKPGMRRPKDSDPRRWS